MNPTLNASVAAEVRAELGRQQITQHQLAARLGWAPALLSRRLTGRTPLRTDDIERIAQVLGVPLSQLIPVEGASR